MNYRLENTAIKRRNRTSLIEPTAEKKQKIHKRSNTSAFLIISPAAAERADNGKTHLIVIHVAHPLSRTGWCGVAFHHSQLDSRSF